MLPCFGNLFHKESKVATEYMFSFNYQVNKPMSMCTPFDTLSSKWTKSTPLHSH